MPAMIGIFGGTFDPVHNGHCRIALELCQQLDLDEVRFVPCGQPPHRGMPQASAEQRLAMLQLAIAGQPEFSIDECELRRDGPSYMVDTLAAIRGEEGDTPLCLLLGSDVFTGLTGWYHWRRLFELAHLVIAHRPGVELQAEGELLSLYQRCRGKDASSLRSRPAGYTLTCPVTQLDISSSGIRAELARGGNVRYLLPDDVWTYMRQQRLYL
jgi:nicotinate-nucleotide adenylyltransferase